MKFQRLWSSIRKPVLSCFILLNLLTVAIMNAPAQWLDQSAPLPLHARQYAKLAGLETRWEMFSYAKGEDWRLLIEGECSQGTFKLPLPGQSPRNFWQENLFDYKEAKLRCNISLDPVSRNAYARYLCRRFACPSGKKLERVRITTHYQRILEQEEARARGRHLAPVIRSEPLEEVACG